MTNLFNEYTYKNPIDQGYERIKLNKKEYENIFRDHESNKHTRKEFYKKDNIYVVHYFTPWWVKILNMILYPILIILHGFSNIKEINREISDMFHEKERGKFYSNYMRVD